PPGSCGAACAVPASAAIAPAAIPADATIFLMLKAFRPVEKWNGARFEGEGIGGRPRQEGWLDQMSTCAKPFHGAVGSLRPSSVAAGTPLPPASMFSTSALTFASS